MYLLPWKPLLQQGCRKGAMQDLYHSESDWIWKIARTKKIGVAGSRAAQTSLVLSEVLDVCSHSWFCSPVLISQIQTFTQLHHYFEFLSIICWTGAGQALWEASYRLHSAWLCDCCLGLGKIAQYQEFLIKILRFSSAVMLNKYTVPG